MRIFLALLFLLITLLKPLFSEEDQNNFEPLYAGTLLAFFPQNIPPGHISVQPYIYYTRTNALYNKHWSPQSIKNVDFTTLSLSLETGITPYLDFTLYLNESYNRFGNRHTLIFTDTSAYLGFQVTRDQKGTSIPDFRILLGETFPTGKYDHLNPKKQGSDISGSGSYQTTFLIVVRKIFYVPKHPFDINLNLYYILSAPTHVRDLSVYLGGPGTHGTVKPGDQFIVNLAIDYSLTRYWALGLDAHYHHQNRSRFSGKTLLPAGLPSSETFSLAPCLEYSYSTDFSLAGGVWFSVAGRNSVQFRSAVFNVYYYF
ncbi:MAG: transporter [Verrucomicrobia bacterium]|nr:transporter [Verrucomicrobiota bacterium]